MVNNIYSFASGLVLAFLISFNINAEEASSSNSESAGNTEVSENQTGTNQNTESQEVERPVPQPVDRVPPPAIIQ